MLHIAHTIDGRVDAEMRVTEDVRAGRAIVRFVQLAELCAKGMGTLKM